jgi:hypothetical protein
MPICAKCGTSFGADRSNCPSCGQPAALPAFPGRPPARNPYRTSAFILASAIAVFLIAWGAGEIEVRRARRPQQAPIEKPEAPAPYVQRDKVAEGLLEGQRVLWVYRFGGGIPKCWAEIESEGHKATVGPWVLTESDVLGGARPIPESVEGYVALFGPTSEKQTYRLVCAATKLAYPADQKKGLGISAFRETKEVTLPNLEAAPKPDKDTAPKAPRGGVSLGDDEDRRPVTPGQNVTLNFLSQGTPAGKTRRVDLKLRFLTPAELAPPAK